MDQKLEQEIINRVRCGEREAYAQLVEAYKRPIFNLAFRMTGSYSDADDLTQETFIKAYDKLYQYQQEKKYFTWIYTICINLVRNHLKKNKRAFSYTTSNHSMQLQYVDNKDEIIILDEKIRKLELYIHQLPIDLREAVILRYQQDLSFEEIAAIIGVSLSTAKMRVYRGLNRLKYLMDKNNL